MTNKLKEPSNSFEKILSDQITILKNLDSHGKDIELEDFIMRGKLIKQNLSLIENMFGFDIVLWIIKRTSIELGHTLSPLDSELVQKMIKAGCSVKEVKKVAEYEK